MVRLTRRPKYALRQRSPVEDSSSRHICNRSSLTMLMSGIMVGYLVMPALVANRLGFDDMLTESQMQPHSVVHHKEPQRITPVKQAERSIPSTATMRGSREDYKIKSVPTRTIRTEDLKNEAEKRIVQNESVYAAHSMPTATTPQIMETPKLPDSKRMKIMVTGGTCMPM